MAKLEFENRVFIIFLCYEGVLFWGSLGLAFFIIQLDEEYAFKNEKKYFFNFFQLGVKVKIHVKITYNSFTMYCQIA